MAVSESYLAFVTEQLEGAGDIVHKRMFGGVGLYADGIFFAVIDNDTIFFKVDETLAQRYIGRGMPPFKPMADKPPMRSYYQVPIDVLEDRDEIVRWAKDSIAVGARKPPRRRKRT